MARNKYIKKQYSREPLRLYSPNNKWATVFPDFSFSSVIAMIDDDPVAAGAVNQYVSKCMGGDYHILKRKSMTVDEKEKLRLNEQFKFRRDILRKTFLLGKLFNNVFWEIVRTSDGKTKAVNVLDSQNVDVISLENGDLEKVKSKTPNHKTGEYTYWDKKDIVWVKFGDRSTGYAHTDMKALWETLCAKSYVKQYVAWLWQTGQYRLHYNFKNASNKSIEDFLAYNRKHASNFKAPFLMNGEMDAKVVRDIRETSSITELLKYYDTQILVLLRIPPANAGIPNSSGRSDSDSQDNSLDTNVNDVRQIVEDSINFDLFPKINKGNSLIKFAPTDIFAEIKVLEAIEKLKIAGLKDEMIKEYMTMKGMVFTGDTWFNPIPDPLLGQAKQNDLAPSRAGKGAGEANKRIGTGDQSTTKEEQL